MLPYFALLVSTIFVLCPATLKELFTWVYIMRELLLNFHLSHTPSSLVEVLQPVYEAAQSGVSEDGILLFANIKTQCLRYELEKWKVHGQ